MATPNLTPPESNDTHDLRRQCSKPLAGVAHIRLFGNWWVAAGVFFIFAGLLAAETGGYGTPFFLLVYTAPAGLTAGLIRLILGDEPSVAGVLVPLVASIALWTVLGGLASAAKHRSARIALLWVLLIHYVSIPFTIIAWPDRIGGVEEFRVAMSAGGPMVWLSIPAYVGAQIFFWRLLLQRDAAHFRRQSKA